MHRHRAEQRKCRCCSRIKAAAVALVAAPVRRAELAARRRKSRPARVEVRERLARREDARKGRLVVLARRASARQQVADRPPRRHVAAQRPRPGVRRAATARRRPAPLASRATTSPAPRPPRSSPPPRCRRRPARSADVDRSIAHELERDRRAVSAEHAADVHNHLHRRPDGVRDGVGSKDIKLPAPVDAPGAAQRQSRFLQRSGPRGNNANRPTSTSSRPPSVSAAATKPATPPPRGHARPSQSQPHARVAAAPRRDRLQPPRPLRQPPRLERLRAPGRQPLQLAGTAASPRRPTLVGVRPRPRRARPRPSDRAAAPLKPKRARRRASAGDRRRRAPRSATTSAVVVGASRRAATTACSAARVAHAVAHVSARQDGAARRLARFEEGRGVSDLPAPLAPPGPFKRAPRAQPLLLVLLLGQ